MLEPAPNMTRPDETEENTAVAVAGFPPELIGGTPAAIVAWFDEQMQGDASRPEPDGTIETAHRIALAVSHGALSPRTRLAYRAGIRAWCRYCADLRRPVLPAAPADVAAFLSDAREPPKREQRPALSLSALGQRRAAITYLHQVAGLPTQALAAAVNPVVRGYRNEAAERNEQPTRKLAARVDLLQAIVAPIGTDPVGLRDRALLLLGFAGAFRRAELAAIEVENLEFRPNGLIVLLTASKGDRDRRGVRVGVPRGQTELCPVRALEAWLAAAKLTKGPLFRRIWVSRRPAAAPADWEPTYTVGDQAMDAKTVAKIVKKRGAAVGLDPKKLGGHSLKRGALNTALDRDVALHKVKQLGRHKSFATLTAYIEEREQLDDPALDGVL